MARANGPELWVIMIEKAYAKLYGGYSKIPKGESENALFQLTGAPYKKYYTE
jgi:calpain-15